MSHIISFVKNQVATFLDVDLYHFQAIDGRLVTISKCSHSCIQVTIDISLHQGNHGEKKWLTYVRNKMSQLDAPCLACEQLQGNSNEIGEQGNDHTEEDMSENRWIVLLDKDTCPVEFACSEQVEKGHTFKETINGFSCCASETEMKKLQETNPTIMEIARDDHATITTIGRVKVSNTSQTMGEFIKRVGADHSSRSKNVPSPLNNSVVFVVDTGIDGTHVDLRVDASLSRNFVGNNPLDWSDKHGHGTHVAGIIAAQNNKAGILGVAPGVRLASVRVLDSKGSGLYSNIIAGLEYILKWKMTNPSYHVIVNLSLGGPPNTVLDAAVKRLVNSKVNVVVAAGNESKNTNLSSPSRVAEVITVAAYSDTNNTMATWSNYGSLIDLQAPGVGITSTYPGNRYAIMSGTSMAAPVVSGTIACLVNTRGGLGTPLDIRNALVRDAKLQSVRNYDKTVGANRNLSLSVTQASASTTNRSIYTGSY